MVRCHAWTRRFNSRNWITDQRERGDCRSRENNRGCSNPIGWLRGKRNCFSPIRRHRIILRQSDFPSSDSHIGSHYDDLGKHHPRYKYHNSKCRANGNFPPNNRSLLSMRELEKGKMIEDWKHSILVIFHPASPAYHSAEIGFSRKVNCTGIRERAIAKTATHPGSGEHGYLLSRLSWTRG